MPYKDPKKQREYQKQWLKNRRDAWIAENGPCIECGSWERLEVDHVDPSTKDAKLLKSRGNSTHGLIWSWGEDRRLAELAKCVARCHECHLVKSSGEYPKGDSKVNSKLTEEQVLEILASDLTHRELGEIYGVFRGTIGKIKRGEKWKHLHTQASAV